MAIFVTVSAILKGAPCASTAGIFKSVAKLEAAIHDYVGKHNAAPEALCVDQDSDVILAKTNRPRARLDSMKSRNQALESEH
jgi:hypothetical protein